MKNLSDNENSIKLSLLFNYRNKTPSQATERMAAYVTVIFCMYFSSSSLKIWFIKREYLFWKNQWNENFQEKNTRKSAESKINEMDIYS